MSSDDNRYRAAGGSHEPLKAARDVIQTLFEELWCLGFKILGRLDGVAIRRSKPAGGERALVVAPHPDDEVYGCGGTLVLHRRAGDRVRICFVTDGRRSRALDLEPDQMANRRREEAFSAARCLGIEELDWLGFEEGDWEREHLVVDLQRILRDFDPQILYAPSVVDFHPEHRRVARALADAVRGLDLAGRVRIRVVELQVPLTSLLANVAVETRDAATAIVDALGRYRSQIGSTLPSLRQKRYAAAYYRLDRQAEVFWEMSPEAYVEVHAGEAGTPARYRGLRYLSISDPLAYLVGRTERHRLRLSVCQHPVSESGYGSRPA